MIDLLYTEYNDLITIQFERKIINIKGVLSALYIWFTVSSRGAGFADEEKQNYYCDNIGDHGNKMHIDA